MGFKQKLSLALLKFILTYSNTRNIGLVEKLSIRKLRHYLWHTSVMV